MNCRETRPIVGCWQKADGTCEQVAIHYTYATNSAGNEIIYAVRYTSSDGTALTIPVGDSVTVGECVKGTEYLTLDNICANVDGVPVFVTPVSRIDKKTGISLPTIYLDRMGNQIIGVVTEASPCDCDCSCNIEACFQVDGFDVFDAGALSPGDSQELTIEIDGVVISTTPHDYTTTTDGVNKSSWYTPWVAVVNSLPGWTMSVLQDANVDNSSPQGLSGNDKMTWQIEYSGTAAQSLRLYKGNIGNGVNNDYIQLNVAADGTVTSETGTGASVYDWGTYPVRDCDGNLLNPGN